MYDSIADANIKHLLLQAKKMYIDFEILAGPQKISRWLNSEYKQPENNRN
jgi:hypothetical protein